MRFASARPRVRIPLTPGGIDAGFGWALIFWLVETALSVEGSTPALGAGSRGSNPLGSNRVGVKDCGGEYGVMVAQGPPKS